MLTVKNSVLSRVKALAGLEQKNFVRRKWQMGEIIGELMVALGDILKLMPISGEDKYYDFARRELRKASERIRLLEVLSEKEKEKKNVGEQGVGGVESKGR